VIIKAIIIIIPSTTLHLGALKLLAVTGIESPFMASTFPSKAPPESKVGSVLTPAAKPHADAQRLPRGAVLSQQVTIFVVLLFTEAAP